MKKLIVSSIIVMFVLGLMSCGKSTDPKDILKEITKATDEYLESLEKAQEVDDFVSVIETYTKKLNEIAPRWEEAVKANPQMHISGISDDFQEVLNRFRESYVKMIKVVQMPKFSTMFTDAKVKEAFEKLKKALDKIIY